MLIESATNVFREATPTSSNELPQESEEGEKRNRHFLKNQALESRFTIKSYEGNDFKKLIEIDKQCFNAFDSYNEKMFHQLLKDNPNSFFGLYSQYQIIGYFIIYRFRRGGYIESIAISPDYQGLGLGKYLMEYIIHHFQMLQYKHITLEVRPTNHAAIKMYERHGFEEVKKLKGYYKDGAEAILMKKRL
jgi:ribosomal-protein-alanine N-acetyltransferase